MEDLFESIIGAVYIDSEKGLDAITRVIGRMLDVSLYLEGQDKGTKGHPKNLLQEWCADKTRRLPTPKYRASVCGPEHAPTYTVECTVGDVIYGVGKGKNIKSAEALAASEALTRLADEYSPESVGQSYAELIKKVEAYRKSHGGKPHEFFDLRESAASTKTRPEFSVKCRFGGVVGMGIGASKKEAQGEAILDTLRRLGAK
jgi:dsRNA-specific ribonuclease